MKKIIHFGKTSFIPIIITLSMLASCKDATPQTYAEKQQAEIKLDMKNMEQFFLGASKLCKDANYKNILGEFRERFDTFKLEDNCCSGFIEYPFINPYEYYLFLFEDEKSIKKNETNPFELKKIRAKLKGKVEKVKSKSDAIDGDNLIYIARESWSIKNYDFDNEKLNVQAQGQGSTSFYFDKMRHVIIELNIESTQALSLDSKKTEKLFDYYKGSNSASMIKFLNSQTTYSLKKPKKGNQNSNEFDVIVKKIEFFYPDNWSKKIGEITF